MIVSKFGGTSVGDGARFASVAPLAASAAGTSRLVVVSAMARVTRELLRLGELAPHAPAQAQEILEALLARHRQALREAGISRSEIPWLEGAIERERHRVLALIEEAHRRGQITPRSADRILAVGELLSSRILAATVRSQGSAVTWVDPRELMATDAHFGAARPDPEEISRRVARLARPHLERGEVVVTGGYIGRAPNGATTTLGFEASDYTATLLGAALEADAVEIWTDVDGVASADPRVVATARIVPALSYEEAADLAFFGAGVLHPKTMAPLVPLGTEIRVRNSFRPAAPGTRISAHGNQRAGVRAVTARGPFTSDELACLLAGDCGAELFSARNGRPGPGLVSTAIAEIPALELPSGNLLERLTGFAGAGDRPLAVVSMVGADIPSVSQFLQSAGEALRDLPVLQIAQRSCANHSSLLVPAELELEAVRRLHRALLEEEGPQS